MGANSGITSFKNGYDYVKRIYGDDKTVIARESTESCCTMLVYDLVFRINFIESSVNNIKLTGEEELAAFATFVC